MQRALTLAREGYWTTPPNPAVGSVVVAGEDIVGEGWHERPGTPHAEVMALADAGERARGATLYVNLEPCSHYGRTPPCTEAILSAGIARVVIAADDPCRRVCGDGITRLREAGLEVSVGVAREEALEMNRRHVLAAAQERPLIIAKTARTLDGRTMGPGRTPRKISGRTAREWVARRRSEVHAVVVGSGTLLADDPRLTARLPDGGLYERQPLRVVVDGRLRTPPEAAIFAREGGEVVIVTAAGRSEGARAAELRSAGARLVGIPTGGDDSPDPMAVLHALAELDVDGLILEGGGTILAAWAARDLVDFWEIVISPDVLGAGGGMFARSFDPPLRVGEITAEELGEDLLVRAVPAPAQPRTEAI